MGADSQAQRVLDRDNAARRLRRVTFFAGALAAAGTGVLAAVTASTTHTRAAVQGRVTTTTTAAKTIPAVPEPTATVSSGSAAPSAPQSAPAVSSAPPVAVSGGS